MLKKRDVFHKKYFYVIFLIILVLLAGILFFKKPKDLSVTIFTKPYNISSECETTDYLSVNILINQQDTYFTSLDKINSSYLQDNYGNSIKLVIVNINLEDNDYTIYDKVYYNYTYKFKVDFCVNSDYELYMEKAVLSLNYANNLHSKINIGSFSYYKHLPNAERMSTNYLAAVTNSDNGTGLWGVKLGLRSMSREDITIKNLKFLDGTIERSEVIKGENKDITNINSCIPSYPTIDGVKELNYTLEYNTPLYFTIGINYLKNNFILPLNCFGIRVKYIYMENYYYYYITPFMFYKSTYFRIPFEELEMITYAYK
ncbi:MAG: hypothetical protein WCR33_00880 [Bacilli bacterium]